MPARSRTPSAIASASIVRPRQAGSRCEKDEPTWSITVTSWLAPAQQHRELRPHPAAPDHDHVHAPTPPLLPTWYGTLVITIPRSNSSASRSRIAVCACSRLCQRLARHELRHHDRDHLVGLAARRDLLDVADDRLDQQPVGRAQHHEPHARAPQAPLLLDRRGLLRVGRDVDGRHVVGQRPRVAQPRHRPAVHAADRQDHAVAVDARRRAEVVERELPREHQVVPVDREEDRHQRRDHQDHDPGAVVELGDREDHGHDRGDQRRPRR